MTRSFFQEGNNARLFTAKAPTKPFFLCAQFAQRTKSYSRPGSTCVARFARARNPGCSRIRRREIVPDANGNCRLQLCGDAMNRKRNNGLASMPTSLVFPPPGRGFLGALNLWPQTQTQNYKYSSPAQNFFFFQLIQRVLCLSKRFLLLQQLSISSPYLGCLLEPCLGPFTIAKKVGFHQPTLISTRKPDPECRLCRALSRLNSLVSAGTQPA